MAKSRNVVLETLTPLVLVVLVLHIWLGLPAFLYAATALLVVLLFIKPLAVILATVWLKFAEVVATVNTKVLLTIIFYLLLTPIAFLFRIFTKNPLRLKAEKGLSSYYSVQDHRYTGDDLGKMW